MKNFPSMLHVLCTFPVPKYTKYPVRLQSNIAYDINICMSSISLHYMTALHCGKEPLSSLIIILRPA